MFKNIKEDIKVVYYEKKFSNYLKALLEHSLHIVILFRFGHFCDKNIPFIGKIFRVFSEIIIRVLYASDISCKAKIGKGFRIMHGHDIVIGASVEIGKYCKVFNGVTLGNKNTETPESKQPKLGDNVIISTGAKILGPIKIGSNTTVGANSVVLKDVPENVVAVGVPARVVKNKLR